MQFECTRGELLEKVQIVQKGVSTRSTLPILTGILFKVEDNKLFLSSTDLEISIECVCDVKTITSGSVVIPARLIGDVLRNLPEAVVKLNSNKSTNQVELECEKAKFNIKTLPPEDFPKTPRLKKEQSCTLKSKLFTDALKQITKATSKDEARPVLTGVLFKINENKLKMVATDSYRLAIKEIECISSMDKEVKLVIPGRVLDEITKIAPKEKSEIRLLIGENQAGFEFDNIQIITRLIEGEFPKYQQLIPESYQVQLRLNKEVLIGATKRVSLLALNNAPIKVSIGDNKLVISSQSSDVGEAIEKLDLKEKVEPITIAFNAQYLLDGLLSINSDNTIFEIVSPLNPALLRADEEKDFLYLVMPVRVGS